MAYTLATAAEVAKVTKPTVFRWIKKGHLSATRTEAGEYRIDPAELQRYLDSIAETEPPRATAQQAEVWRGRCGLPQRAASGRIPISLGRGRDFRSKGAAGIPLPGNLGPASGRGWDR